MMLRDNTCEVAPALRNSQQYGQLVEKSFVPAPLTKHADVDLLRDCIIGEFIVPERKPYPLKQSMGLKKVAAQGNPEKRVAR